jgi:hypothetical protein
MRAEIIDVSSGMVIRRLHFASSRESPKAWTDNVIGALRLAAVKATTKHGLHHAITLLGVGTLPQMNDADSARTLVSAGLLSEVDATPGCIALTRTQMEPLVVEQSLGGENSVWQAGWSLTAGLGAVSPEILELRLRLKNLSNGQMFDVTGQRSPTAIRELVKETWAKVMTKAGLTNDQPMRQIANDNESKELLFEARWRMANKEYDSAARIADAAHFLGSLDPSVQSIRIQARVRAIGNTDGLYASSSEMGWVLSRLQDLVETVEIMNEQLDPSIANQLAIFREATAHGGAPPVAGPSHWFAILAKARSALPQTGLTAPQLTMIARFDRGFEQWCRKSFTQILAKGKDTYAALLFMEDFRDVNPHWFPWLTELVVDYTVASSSFGEGHIKLGQLIYHFELCQEKNYRYYRNPFGKDIGKKILAKLDKFSKQDMERLACEAEFLVASDQRRCDLAHEVADLRAKALFLPGSCSVILFPNSLLSTYRAQSPQAAYHSIIPDHVDSLCGGVLPPSSAVGEVFRDFKMYQAWLGRPKDRMALMNLIAESAQSAAALERKPGITRLRSRLQVLAKLAPFAKTELSKLMQRLPEDLPQQ